MKRFFAEALLSLALCPFARGQSPSVQSITGPAVARSDQSYLSNDPLPYSASAAALGRNYIFGNWKGLRTQLADRGVVPTVLLITDPFGSIHGGQRTGASDYNLAGIDVRFDTARLFGLRGGQIVVGAAINFGNSLSRQYVGNSFPIQLADVAGAQPRLTYLSFTQSLAANRLILRGGRVSINSVFGEEFAGSEYAKAMASVAFNLVPLGIFLNAPGAAGYPKTTWGARAKVAATSRAYVQIAVYNANTKQLRGDQHGVDFSLRGPALVLAEAGTSKAGDSTSAAKRQNLKFGTFYNGGTYSTVDRGALTPAKGLVGLYALGDRQILRFHSLGDTPKDSQELSRWGDAERERHLGAFASVVIVPQKRTNQAPYFFDLGLVAYGLTGRRPRDTSGIGFAYSSNSRGPAPVAVSGSGAATPKTPPNEMILEANYGIAVKPGLSVQPDLQYSIHPKGSGEIPGPASGHVPNAIILGFNIVCNF